MSLFAISGTKAPVYRCQFLGFCDPRGGPVDLGEAVAQHLVGIRARVRMAENHMEAQARPGEIIITSDVRSIDLEMRVIVTQSSIFVYDPLKISKPRHEV